MAHHPRSRFRDGSDFVDLAGKYDELRPYCKLTRSGFAKIDFDNVNAVAALTRALFQDCYGFDVVLPADRLCPRLPQRLNYLLWVQDLVGVDAEQERVRVLDIGTGASCVLPLVGHGEFGWRFVGTEVDKQSLAVAQRNVEHNGLGAAISLVLNKNADKILDGVVGAEERFDAVVCNPPFYESSSEKDRLARDGATVSSDRESVVAGGETAFVRRFAEESKGRKDQARWFTSMVGGRINAENIEKALRASGISTTRTAQFSQGRTSRWGVAWSFQEGEGAGEGEGGGRATKRKREDE